MGEIAIMLHILRWLSELFYAIGSWFEDLADGIDENFHEQLRNGMR